MFFFPSKDWLSMCRIKASYPSLSSQRVRRGGALQRVSLWEGGEAMQDGDSAVASEPSPSTLAGVICFHWRMFSPPLNWLWDLKTLGSAAFGLGVPKCDLRSTGIPSVICQWGLSFFSSSSWDLPSLLNGSGLLLRLGVLIGESDLVIAEWETVQCFAYPC